MLKSSLVMFARLCRDLRAPQEILVHKIRMFKDDVRVLNPLEEEKIDIGGDIKINCLRTGHGPKTILFIPGSIGSIWTDFRHQVEGLDKSKYSLVVMDVPGLGRSRPPVRDYPINFCQRDAEWCARLMQELNVDRYSVVGWSIGGVYGIIMAALYPQRVEKLVTTGTVSYISEKLQNRLNCLRDINKTANGFRGVYSGYYGEECFRQLLNKFADGTDALYRDRGGDFCTSFLSRVVCPTLLVHGAKDRLNCPSHVQYMKKRIRNSRVQLIEDGGHACHISHYEEFNRVVQGFLMSSPTVIKT